METTVEDKSKIWIFQLRSFNDLLYLLVLKSIFPPHRTTSLESQSR
jgi:hypothetical protein